MKAVIITLAAVFCFFLQGFLDLYINRETAGYISLLIFIGIAGITLLFELVNTFERMDREEQDKRIDQTRIASIKRKSYRKKTGE